jgi:hypothetical protein
VSGERRGYTPPGLPWPVDPSTPMRGPLGDVMPADWWADLLWVEATCARLDAQERVSPARKRAAA